MIAERIVQRKRRLQRNLQDERAVAPKPAQDRLGLMAALHHQVGNRAVQRLLAGRQTEQKQAAAKEPVEAGQIKIEKPKIEEYEVSGNSLAEIANQLLPPERWYEYEYQYNPKIENGLASQVDITVIPTIHVPRWVGPGWANLSDVDKTAWVEMLKNLGGGLDKYDDVSKLPPQLLGLDWKKAPEAIKGEWKGILQEIQRGEEKQIDIIRRRVMVLQKRLLHQPADQLKAILDQFQKDVTLEEAAYSKQRQFGREQKINLSTAELIQ
jgi:hypothetical protein